MAEGAGGLAVAPDGKIVVAGSAGFPSQGPRYPGSWSFHLARYLPSGALDATFGESGTVTTSFEHTPFPSDQAFPDSVVLQPDGRILVLADLEQIMTGVQGEDPVNVLVHRHRNEQSADEANDLCVLECRRTCGDAVVSDTA